MNAASVAVQTAAAATTIAGMLPLAFHSQNLPLDVCNWYNTCLNPTKIMTKLVMVPFAAPTGGVGPILSYLGPCLGAGVQPSTADSNHIITHNRHYFPLVDQRTDGLVYFYSNILVYNGTTTHDIPLW